MLKKQYYTRRRGLYNTLEMDIFLFGILIARFIKDYEEIPKWAYYQNACLGDTEWKAAKLPEWKKLT